MQKYIPDIYQKSIYTIDYSKLMTKGIKCLLFDLDNTIIVPHTSEVSEKAKDLFISLKQKGFKVIIFSNSLKSKVKVHQQFLKVNAISLACKPLSYNFKKIIKKTNFKPSEIAIIGDQLLTDIAGGNNVGITTILVNPVVDKNRFFENMKMRSLERKNLFYKGRYYD